MSEPINVLVTGGSGYVGRKVVAALAATDQVAHVTSVDIRASDAATQGVHYEVADVSSDRMREIVADVRPDVVVHLAAVVTPTPDQTREDQYRIDVAGTDNVVQACLDNGVRKLVYTSSGAAYGYSAENGPLISEDDPLHGNQVFAYSWHKRLVEEHLAQTRREHPELEQLIFRVSTILGPDVDNQITALFEQPVIPAIQGVDTPFCFVSDEDVVRYIVIGTLGPHVGIYNLTGDGVMTLREIARELGNRVVAVPEGVLRTGLGFAHGRGWSVYGPEQVLFLRYRPVLANGRLKRDFGRPATTREVFARYRSSRV
jgi:UDP-glucose 4-epimerase